MVGVASSNLVAPTTFSSLELVAYPEVFSMTIRLSFKTTTLHRLSFMTTIIPLAYKRRTNAQNPRVG